MNATQRLVYVVVLLTAGACVRPPSPCGPGTVATTRTDGTVQCDVVLTDAGVPVVNEDAGPATVCGAGTHPEAKADGTILCEPDDVAEGCGPEPEIPYVCADGHFPCDCVESATGTLEWQCHHCPAIDCNLTPQETVCAKDLSCVSCHGLATGNGTPGIENMHPWLYVACVDCHGGVGRDPNDATRALSKDEAHVAMPVDIRDPTAPTQPKRAFYENMYLGRGGLETVTGGLEWLQFINPSDLRVVQNTCANQACHGGMDDKVKKSTMSTLVGKFDAMLQAVGIRGDSTWADELGNDSFAKHLATVGTLNLTDPDWDRDTSPPGSVPGLAALVTKDRENEARFPNFTEQDIYKEMTNKICGDCHLGNNGSNDKYAQFRGAGCSACHLPYDFTGRSSSTDPMIDHQEPSYPQAYTKIEFPERPHPVRHQITRVPKTQDCFQCHNGSARSVLQYMGVRIDDNKDLTRMKNNGVDIDFTYARELVDNTTNPQARLRGHDMEQLIKFEDLDEDGRDDTPPDIHYELGLECIDCHNSSEMHGDGKIYSRQSSATKIYCTHCHGTLEHAAAPDDVTNPINELYFASSRPSRKSLWQFDAVPAYGDHGYPFVTQPGIWMRTKSRNEWHYVPQVKWGVQWDPNAQDCFGDGRRIDPRSGGAVCTPGSSISHGRWNGLNDASGDFVDGVGPRPNVEVIAAGDGTATPRFGFSHLGDPTDSGAEIPAGGLQCTACHAKWQAMRYGNHLGLKDTDGAQRFYEWDRITGKTTLGKQKNFDFTFVSNLDLQLAINSKGRIAWFLPARLKLFVNQSVLGNNDEVVDFYPEVTGTQSSWKTYRDTTGMGNALYEQGGIDNAPGWPSTCLDNTGYCDSNPNKNVNAGLGMDQMEPHTVRRIARDCNACHLQSGGGGIDRVGAVYGWRPGGYTAQTSAYLSKVTDTQTNHGNYSTANGFTIADDGITHKLDWLVDEDTGYPLVYTIHVRTDDGQDGRPARGYETWDPDVAGPITKTMIDQLKRIEVNNVYDGNQGD